MSELVYTFFLMVFCTVTFPIWLEGIITVTPILIGVFGTQYALHSLYHRRWLKVSITWEKVEVL